MVPQGCEGHFYQWRRSNGKINDPKNIFYCLMISLNSFSSLVSPKLPLSEVGYEPTPPFGDQNAQKLRRIICLEPDTLIQECEGQLYQWRRSNGKIKDPKNIIYCLIISLNSISSLVNPLQKATSFHFKRASVRSGIWTHASIRRPETSATEKDYLSWVWRLRPLGHSDMNTQWWEWYFYQWSWSDGKIKDPNYYLFSHYFFKFNF